MLTIALLVLSFSASPQGAAAGTFAPAASPPPPTLPAVEQTLMLRLRSGDVVFGAIEEHDPEGLSFRRLTDGGLVRLAWRFLDPGQEDELRRKFGYVDVIADEVLVDADLVVLVDGSEMIGIVAARDGQTVVLKTASGLLQLPARRVAAISRAEAVPALELYTKDELYTAELVRANADSAAGNVALGEFCERIRDFARAAKHYEAAAALAPGSPEIEFALARAREKSLVQEQLDALGEIDHLKRRGHFEEALAAVETFPERFPNTPLTSDLYKLRDGLLKARDRALRETVQSRWFFWSSKLARRLAQESTLEQIEAVAAETLLDQVLEQVTADAREIAPEIEPEKVLVYWTERKRGRWRPTSYGNETWLLGEDRALREFDKQASQETEKPTTELDKQRADFEEKLRKFLASQERERRARSNEDETADRQRAWEEASSDDRARWTFALFVETSGAFDLNPKLLSRNCRSCGGTGVTEVIYTGSARTGDTGGGGSDLTRCATCRGIGVVRRIQYR